MTMSLADIAYIGFTIFLAKHVSGFGPNAHPLQDTHVSSLAPNKDGLRSVGLHASTVQGLLDHLLPPGRGNAARMSLGRPDFIPTDQSPILLPVDVNGAGRALPFLPPSPQIGELEIGRHGGLPIIRRGSLGKDLLRARMLEQLRKRPFRRTQRNRKIGKSNNLAARKYKSYKKQKRLARKKQLLRKIKQLKRRKNLRNLYRKKKLARNNSRLAKQGKASGRLGNRGKAYSRLAKRGKASSRLAKRGKAYYKPTEKYLGKGRFPGILQRLISHLSVR